MTLEKVSFPLISHTLTHLHAVGLNCYWLKSTFKIEKRTNMKNNKPNTVHYYHHYYQVEVFAVTQH